jgi:hypothetical protein
LSVTVLKGSITTADPLSDEQVIDMRNEFAELDPDDSQFVTLLTKLNSRAAVREKIEWLEDQLRPRLLTLAASAASADSAVTLTSGQLLIVGSAYKQGASYGTSRIVKRVLGFNYTQIQRDAFSFTGTETSIEEYGGRNPMKEQVKKLIEHKQSINTRSTELLHLAA